MTHTRAFRRTALSPLNIPMFRTKNTETYSKYLFSDDQNLYASAAHYNTKAVSGKDPTKVGSFLGLYNTTNRINTVSHFPYLPSHRAIPAIYGGSTTLVPYKKAPRAECFDELFLSEEKFLILRK